MQILAGHSGGISIFIEPFKRATAEPRRPWRIAESSFLQCLQLPAPIRLQAGGSRTASTAR